MDEESIEGKEILISIKRWLEELKLKSEWASHLKEKTKSKSAELNKERSIIEEEWDELRETQVITPKMLIQNRSWEAK